MDDAFCFAAFELSWQIKFIAGRGAPMPTPKKPRASAGSPSAMEAFHATFQGALNDEFEALVRDLRAAAGTVADSTDSSDPKSHRVMVGELVARWTFLIATYRAHVAAEDEVLLPAVAARVSNVAHAYELEHEAEDELFESITTALDDANRSVELLVASATTSDQPSTEYTAAREKLRTAVQRAARIAHATKTVLHQHLAKEAAHLVPLLNDNFTNDEQSDLVKRFIQSVPAGWVGPVLEKGPTTGERGPLRTLLASWLEKSSSNTQSSSYEQTDTDTRRPTKRHKSNEKISEKEIGPIDHIFQFHAALRKELITLEADVLALPPIEETSNRADALRELEGRFVFFWGVYRAHSRSEDELVFPALEDKDELHNVSHSYTLDHEHEAELFVDLDACLRDLRVAAGIGTTEDAEASSLEFGDQKNSDKIVSDIERKLQASCAAVRICLETHVAREEAELWPLFEKHFTNFEQRRLVGLIIGRTGAEVLQSMLSWQRKALTETEKSQMIGGLRDASKNTRFASWLDTWWSGEEKGDNGCKEGTGEKEARVDSKQSVDSKQTGTGTDTAATGTAREPPTSSPSTDPNIEGLRHVQEYLSDRQLSSMKTSASSAAKAAAAAAAAAAAVDKTGYTPSWDDMFRMNRQQLEESARQLSRDDSLAPERKAYLMQHLLAARWICAQQRTKKAKEDGTEGGEGDDELNDPKASKTPSSEVTSIGTTASALKLAGAKKAASYRLSAEDADLILCQPAEDNSKSQQLGCKHYSRGARLVAACCGAAHVCRFCHDEAEDHTIDRYATKEMVCMHCSTRQLSAADCVKCEKPMAKYFCSVCVFWDDAEDAYHCPFCNVCRRGKGLGKDFFHCMQCNSCVSLTMGPHDCSAGQKKEGEDPSLGAMESDCPVCKDFLWNSDTPVKAMPCGHMMHTRCFEAYTKHYYTCPLCRKSLGDFSAYFRMLDAILAEEKDDNEETKDGVSKQSQPKTTQNVSCNDCGETTTAPFHFVYHKCTACHSYNTRVLGGPNTTTES